MAFSAELLPRLRCRDRTAQEELRVACFRQLVATCRTLLGNGCEDEVAEDVFTEFLYEHVDKVRQGQAIYAYLRMMTVRRCLRIRRAQRRGQALPEHDALPVGSEAEVLDGIERSRKVARLKECVINLTTRTQIILKLRYGKSLTQEMIGNTLGLSKQYVGRVLQSALSSLKKCMERAK